MQFSVRALRKDADVTPTIFFSLILKDKLLKKKKKRRAPQVIYLISEVSMLF